MDELVPLTLFVPSGLTYIIALNRTASACAYVQPHPSNSRLESTGVCWNRLAFSNHCQVCLPPSKDCFAFLWLNSGPARPKMDREQQDRVSDSHVHRTVPERRCKPPDGLRTPSGAFRRRRRAYRPPLEVPNKAALVCDAEGKGSASGKHCLHRKVLGALH